MLIDVPGPTELQLPSDSAIEHIDGLIGTLRYQPTCLGRTDLTPAETEVKSQLSSDIVCPAFGPIDPTREDAPKRP